MTALQFILPHVLPFTVVIARLSGLLIFAPLLGSQIIPARVKAMLTFLLALCVYPAISMPAPPLVVVDLLSLLPLLIAEAMIGLTIGLMASMPVLFLQMGGLLMGQQMGLGIASVFNPATDTEGDIISQILLYVGMAAFLSMGGLEIMHATLVSTFETVPPGAFLDRPSPLPVIVGMVGAGMELAVRVASPVVAIIFLETLATGFLMKTVPQLNILSFGFPVKILMGLFVLVASIGPIGEATVEAMQSALDLIVEWSRTL